MKVMIVEDQTMIRSLLESYFRTEDGYRITASIPCLLYTSPSPRD